MGNPAGISQNAAILLLARDGQKERISLGGKAAVLGS